MSSSTGQAPGAEPPRNAKRVRGGNSVVPDAKVARRRMNPTPLTPDEAAALHASIQPPPPNQADITLQALFARVEANAPLDRAAVSSILPCMQDFIVPDGQPDPPTQQAKQPAPPKRPATVLMASAPPFTAALAAMASNEAETGGLLADDVEMEDERDENDPDLVAEQAKYDAQIVALLAKQEAAKKGGPALTKEEQAEVNEVVFRLDDVPALTVDFLDVGQGDSTLFVCDDGTTMMIDLGSVNSAELGTPIEDSLKYLAKSLHTLMGKRGLKRPCIDRLYITHCDKDHYNLVPSLFRAVKAETGQDLDVKTFYVTEDPGQYTNVNNANNPDDKISEDEKMSKILKKAKEDGKLVQYVSDYAGDDKAEFLNESKTVTVRTLCANSVSGHKTSKGTESKRNMSSIVVMVQVKPTEEDGVTQKILMMGDAESAVENRLMTLHPKAIEKATILHVGHHGSKNAAQEPFLEKVDPRIAQFSADMKWQHPYDETVRRLTDNPKLRVNEGGEGDVSHPIVVEKPGKTVGHEVRTTRSGVITNLTGLEKDKSGSDAAEEAEKAKRKPVVATGEQWRVVFSAEDGSYMKFTNARNEDAEQLT